jgi:hypothetical protein
MYHLLSIYASFIDMLHKYHTDSKNRIISSFHRKKPPFFIEKAENGQKVQQKWAPPVFDGMKGG